MGELTCGRVNYCKACWGIWGNCRGEFLRTNTTLVFSAGEPYPEGADKLMNLLSYDFWVAFGLGGGLTNLLLQ